MHDGCVMTRDGREHNVSAKRQEHALFAHTAVSGRTDKRHFMKPSETICAARVATMDELWPAARSARANSVAAAVAEKAVT